MTPAQIERAKLLAGWFDRASTSCVTVGILAPVAGALYIPPEHPPAVWVYAAGAIIWLFAAVALHLLARVALGGLEP